MLKMSLNEVGSWQLAKKQFTTGTVSIAFCPLSTGPGIIVGATE
jgi:hypothetical protein